MAGALELDRQIGQPVRVRKRVVVPEISLDSLVVVGRDHELAAVAHRRALTDKRRCPIEKWVAQIGRCGDGHRRARVVRVGFPRTVDTAGPVGCA